MVGKNRVLERNNEEGVVEVRTPKGRIICLESLSRAMKRESVCKRERKRRNYCYVNSEC